MQAALPLCVSALTAVAGYLGGKLKERKSRQESREEHDRLMEEGMKAILRRDLVDAYEDYVENGKTLTVERKQEIDDEWAAYDGLNGNGTGHQMYQAICNNSKVKVVR